MMVEHKHNEGKENEVSFFNAGVGNATGLLTFDSKRVRVEGRFSLNLCTSAKYGKEIQLQVFTDREPVVQDRNPSKWNRAEIYMPVEYLDALIEMLVIAREHHRMKP